MRFGANYTPRRGWFHHWLDFDPAEQREDFETLAGLGLDHLRVFCLWPLFQPQRGLIRQRALDDLARLYDIAAGAGLDVTVDVLQGHLSSFEFYPSWTVTHHQRNIFTDPDVVEAEAELVAAVAHRLRDHGNHLGVSLANEPNNMIAPTGRDTVTVTEADAWISRLLAAATEADPGHPHTHSAFDAVWYDEDHPFTPRQLTTLGARTVVHPGSSPPASARSTAASAPRRPTSPSTSWSWRGPGLRTRLARSGCRRSAHRPVRSRRTRRRSSPTARSGTWPAVQACGV